MEANTIYNINCLDGLKSLPDKSIHCSICSPPYFGLRNYLPADSPEKHNEIGSGGSMRNYIASLVEIFSELHRVLRDDGTFWLNLGDSYAANRTYQVHMTKGNKAHTFSGGSSVPDGLKSKDMCGIPWRVAFALQDAGWYLRRDIIWAKGVSFNEKFSGACTPESCVDRPSTSHEYVFLFSKNPQYFYDKEAIAEKITNPYSLDCIAKAEKEKLTGRPATNIFSKEERREKGQKGLTRAEMGSLMKTTRNVRSVWTVQTRPYKGAHFATFPEKLVEPMVKAGTSEYGCCADCGSPYYRIVAKGEPDEEHKRLCGADSNGGYLGQSTKDYESAKAQDASKLKARILNGMRERVTVAWSKKCSCKTEEIVPCTVIDPFMGSGTVALVAQRLGRQYIGFDLNPEYCEIAKKRLEKEEVML